jgi:hypothetical protein
MGVEDQARPRHTAAVGALRLSIASLAACGLACGPARGPRLPAAGTDGDDGAGELAAASHQLRLGGEDGAAGERRSKVATGGATYGGATYAGYSAQWDPMPPAVRSGYQTYAGPTGAIAGVVRWPTEAAVAPGATATTTTATDGCGEPRRRPDRGASDVAVYVEQIGAGRALPSFGRPVVVGGVIEKRGCALWPRIQLAAPLPLAVTVHGDASAVTLLVTAPSGEARAYPLDEGGLARVPLAPGITRLEGDDHRVAAAWVIGATTPYYAITDDAGRYRLDELPPGAYEVTYWQAPAVTVDADGRHRYGAPRVVRRLLRVVAGQATAADVVLPPS